MIKRVTPQERSEVLERAGYRCEYCLTPVSHATDAFTVEHIHPRQKGGDNALDNLAFACQGCNGAKHIKVRGVDPLTSQSVPLYHPRRQRWHDHFAWNEDFTRVLGLTPCGRASIHIMQLNRNGLMNLRMALRAVGVHPPETRQA